MTPTCRLSAFGLVLALALLAGACHRKPQVKERLAELQESFPTQEENVFVQAAVAAVRTNGYAQGVIMLQSAQQTPGMNAQQLMATQNAMEALIADLTVRADRGDREAKAALALIERTRSQ